MERGELKQRLQRIRESVWKLEWDYVQGESEDPRQTGMIHQVELVPGGVHVVFDGLLPTFPSNEPVGRGISTQLKDAYLWPLVHQLRQLNIRLEDRVCAWFVHYFGDGTIVDVDNRLTKWVVNAFMYARIIPDDNYRIVEIHASGYPCIDGWERSELYLLRVEEFMKQYRLMYQNLVIGRPKNGTEKSVDSV